MAGALARPGREAESPSPAGPQLTSTAAPSAAGPSTAPRGPCSGAQEPAGQVRLSQDSFLLSSVWVCHRAPDTPDARNRCRGEFGAGWGTGRE